MMKHLLCLAALCCFFLAGFAQTPVNMAAQPSFTYTENFADIANWTFSTATQPGDGTFTAGIGASAWRGYEPTGTGTIPNGTRITQSTSFFQTQTGPGSSAGLYRQGQSFSLLSTGTTDNTSSVAFDLFLNFSGLNAGTLSFDWASINNSTGNRRGSLRIYTSVDGVVFTELAAANVLNVINNSPTSGQISFVALPASFNNSATARIRFYYHNGTGGTTGSRPKIQVDNVQVTAVPNVACTTPSAQPTGLTLTPGFNAVNGNFTAASPASQGYLVIRSSNNTLNSFPVNGVHYAVGDNLGDGTVVYYGTNTSFNDPGLSAATTYHYFVFAVNHLCTGGPLYFNTAPLTGSTTTTSANDPCTAPAVQPTNLVLSNFTTTSIRGNFSASTSPNADRYLVVRSLNPTLSAMPVNGTQYYASSNLGGGVVVTKTPLTSFTANGLASGTQYYFFVFAVHEDNCIGGPAYNTVAPLTATGSTISIPVCSTPPAQPTNLELTTTTQSVNGFFHPATGADGYLVLYSTNATLSATPQNGVNYSAGTALGNAVVLSNSTATAFIATGLSAATNYHFFVFSKRDQCTGGPLYLTANPLQMQAATTATAPFSYYYGNLHSHSRYSDGNQDNPSFTPADNYAYAKNSLCMDFLGISDHNHSQAGMQLSRYSLGLAQATAARTANFLALYGMEWGVISNGGHVLVYGINQLLGWEPGNHDIFVPRSDYTGTPPTTGTTGLFKTINDWPSTAVALLAHPESGDFNNIANRALTPTADSAVAGVAIESGPANSTNTTYSDPASRLSTYGYFKRLLARGYRVAPNIDHDNHFTNFGRTNYSRLTVIAPDLQESNFLTAIKNRRFYATHDCDTRLSFTLNNQMMGSEFTGTTPPAISVHAFDPTRPSTPPKIRLMYGVPGNMILPVVLDSATAFVYNFTDFSMPEGTSYYYVEVQINGDYAISAPIWYTRTGTVTPVTLLSFTASATPERKVRLQWRTVNEVNNQQFVVERSADGVRFQAIDSLPGRNLAGEHPYSLLDHQPLPAMNYYRLRQVDFDGTASYSRIVAVDLTPRLRANVSLYPNPVGQQLTVAIQSETTGRATLILTDALGRRVQTQTVQLMRGTQQHRLNVAQLASGVHFITLQMGDEQLVQRFVKQ